MNTTKILLAYCHPEMEQEAKKIIESAKHTAQQRFTYCKALAETRFMLIHEVWEDINLDTVIMLEKGIRCCGRCNYDLYGHIKRFCMDCTKYNLK